VPNLIAGLGTSAIFVPLTTLSIGTLRNEQMGNATGLQNLVRNVGGSVGLSLVSTMVERYSQAHQALLVAQLSPLNPEFQKNLTLRQGLLEHHFDLHDAWIRTQDLLYGLMLQQSSYWAFMDLFYAVACLSAVCVLCVFVFKKSRKIHAVALSE
jgi:MFS transporter, DHA2 family, multidrug resistance protein